MTMGHFLWGLIRVGLVQGIVVNLRIRTVVRLGSRLRIRHTLSLSVTIVGRDNSGNGGRVKTFEIVFMTNKQVIKLFEHEQCFTDTDQTCNATEIWTKAIQYMESKINIKEYLINVC